MGIGKRWALLEHVDSPDDPLGKHFDLLLEDNSGCRTWRLKEIPLLDGPFVDAVPSPIHKIHWLSRKHALLSEGRGVVSQFDKGFFLGELPLSSDEVVKITLHGKRFSGYLSIGKNSCRITSLKQNNFS